MKQKEKANERAQAQTDCEQGSFQFQGLGPRQVVSDFSGGFVSSDGGVLLLRQADRSIVLTRGLVGCFVDRRGARFVEHQVQELVAQRLYALALGYEDLSDHSDLRRDPLLAVAADKLDPLGERRDEDNRGKALAAPATLQRLESAVDHPGSRYHKLCPVIGLMRQYLIKSAVRTLSKNERTVIIDFDATDARLHGHQEGRFFHAYYGDYCYLPLLAYIGSVPVWEQLRTADRDACEGTVEALEQIVPTLRRRCPKAQIVLRGDSGFCREETMRLSETDQVDYCLGLARNDRLSARLRPTMDAARIRAALCGGHTREFTEFEYRTLDSWSRARRVIGKA